MSDRLLGHDAIRPLDERNENGGITEFGLPRGEIGFGYPAGPGASSTREDGYFLRDDFVAHFAERWPADGNDRVRRGPAHQESRVAGEEDLNVVPGIR